jgi:hypothetical protein
MSAAQKGGDGEHLRAGHNPLTPAPVNTYLEHGCLSVRDHATRLVCSVLFAHCEMVRRIEKIVIDVYQQAMPSECVVRAQVRSGRVSSGYARTTACKI